MAESWWAIAKSCLIIVQSVLDNSSNIVVRDAVNLFLAKWQLLVMGWQSQALAAIPKTFTN